MKAFLNLILLVVFCLWLIPLGVFIARDNQAQMCGGQRAFCMCLVSHAKQVSPGPSMIVTDTAPGASQKESVGTSGPYFDAALYLNPTVTQLPLNLPPIEHFPSQLIIRNIEHIPKV